MVELGFIMTLMACCVVKDDLTKDGCIKHDRYEWIKHYVNEMNEPKIYLLRGSK